MSALSGEVGDVGDVAESGRPPRDRAERLLLPDLMEAASDLSRLVSAERPDVEVRGLSVLVPGIFDRSELKDRVEPLVSDLLKEGMEPRAGPFLSSEVDDALPLGVEVPEPPFDG
jgi:hypothetical protein